MTQLVVAINSISSGSIEPKLWKNLLAQLRQANPIYYIVVGQNLL